MFGAISKDIYTIALKVRNALDLSCCNKSIIIPREIVSWYSIADTLYSPKMIKGFCMIDCNRTVAPATQYYYGAEILQ